MFDGLGRHVIGELYGCEPALLRDTSFIRNAAKKAAEKAGSTIVSDLANKFDGGEGVSYILAIKESHISIHTWPEHSYAAVDIYTCGDNVNPWNAFEELLKLLNPKSVSVMEIRRGLLASHNSRTSIAVRDRTCMRNSFGPQRL